MVKRAIATTELLLIFPAALFMTSVLVCKLQPLQYEPASTAQRIVMWYAVRQWTLWVLLIVLPLTVLVTGCATLLRSSPGDVELPHRARQTAASIRRHTTKPIVAATTLAAGVILVIVVLHMLAN